MATRDIFNGADWPAFRPASDRGVYRLPSEAEWEYAARGGTTTRYSWGDDAGAADQYAWHSSNSRDRVQSAGRLKPNRFGLHDVHGNVWEWVEDCLHDTYNGAPSNGSAWPSGNYQSRVLRGGTWYSFPQSLRSADRSSNPADISSDSFGFRVARTITP